MQPSDAFYKTKRNLLIFVGCLFLAIFAGFKIVNNEQRISVLPFQLEQPEFLSTILFVIVAFNIFQLSLQWAAQNAEIQQNLFHRIDFISTTAIAGLSILCYLWSVASPLLSSVAVLAKFELIGSIIASVLGLLAAIYSSLRIEKVSERFGRWLKREARSTDEEISRILVGGHDWVLIFNPNTPNGRKGIGFDADGTITLGKNNNEHKWKVRNGLLEIFNSKDQVFSRFTYDKAKNVFYHTNDADTLSIRNQKIVSNADLVRSMDKP